MKRLMLILLMAWCACPVNAHEFWLEPAGFRFKPGATTSIQLMVGEDYTGEKVTLSRSRVVKLFHYCDTVYNLANPLPDDSIGKFGLTLNAAGGHLIAFNSNNRLIELEALKFNNYLRSEGLDPIADLRAAQHDTMKAGREMYQRCVKTLLQAGDIFDSVYATHTGMRLEIIPAAHPYRIKATTSSGFKVLYNGKPLQHALVLAWHKTKGKTTHTTARSDANGNVVFPVSPDGRWMISTVHMVPYGNPAEADWQSYWASYTFGY